MIWALACSCGGSETLVRKKLRKYGYQGWGTIPVYQGKPNCLAQIEAAKDVPEVAALISHINDSSSFAVILGSKDGTTAWADIKHNDIVSDGRAEAIVQALA